MKRKSIGLILILILILGTTLTGCKKKATVSDPTSEPNKDPIIEVGEEEKENIMKEFNTIVEGDNEPFELVSFIDENIKKLTQVEGDRMVDALERSLEEHLDGYATKILSIDKENELMNIAGSEFFYPKDKIKDIKNEKLKEEVTNLYGSMYKLVNIEGGFYPIIDYAKLKAYTNISDEWKDYLAIKAMDSDNPPLVDAGLRITFDELGDRILKTENYLNKYIDGQRQEEMIQNYKNKLSVYLKGSDNTPIADYSSKKIFDDILASYEKTSNVENHITGVTLQKYIEAIKENKNIIDKKILEKADALVKEAVEILSEFK